MSHLSVKIPGHLHQLLEAKALDMGLPSISDVVRVLLSTALENVAAENDSNNKIQYKILQHVVTSYYLLKEQTVNVGVDGLYRNKRAHDRGEKAMLNILGQHSEHQSTKL